MCPYPTVVLMLPSLSSPFSANRARASSTSEYISLTGIDRSYLYTRPSLPAASGSDSRSDQRDWTCVSSCASVPSVMVSFSSSDSSRPPSFCRSGGAGQCSLYRVCTKSATHLVVVILVATAGLDQDIKRFLGPFLRRRLERRLGPRVLEDHLEALVVKELERRQDLAELGARLLEDGLDRGKVRDREDRNVVGLFQSRPLDVRLVRALVRIQFD